MCIISGNAYFALYARFVLVEHQSLREVVQQQTNKFFIQFYASKAGKIGTGTLDTPWTLIGARRKQCIENVSYRNQPCMGMDLVPLQAEVAASINALMMLKRHSRSSTHRTIGMAQDTVRLYHAINLQMRA